MRGRPGTAISGRIATTMGMSRTAVSVTANAAANNPAPAPIRLTSTTCPGSCQMISVIARPSPIPSPLALTSAPNPTNEPDNTSPPVHRDARIPLRNADQSN